MLPDQSQHASLSGSVLPETPSIPRIEGNHEESDHSPYAASPHRFGDWLDDDGFEPDWHEDPNASADHLRAAEALLMRHEQGCRHLQLLPAGYHGEDCDREEFFYPGRVLRQATAEPRWGCVDETEPGALPDHLSDAIDRTIAELHRGFDHQRPISGRLRLRLMQACWAELKLLRDELTSMAAKGEVA